MQDNFRSLASAPFNKLRLAGNHGYRFQGDLAFLNAELVSAPASDERAQSAQHWALQLWACESPHQGGALRGIKVAQAELSKAKVTHAGEHEPSRLEAETFANLPAQGEYAMVLVLAAGEGGQYDQVHDFSNYAERQQFVGPRLEGSSGYRFDNDGVLLQAEGVRNTRDEDNLSGSLALELWALSEPYQGGDLRGTLLASAALGRLGGGSEERYIERYAELNQAPVGEWRLALVLTEWTHVGHVARDFCNFALPYQVQAQEAHALAAAVEAPKKVAAVDSKSAAAVVSSPAAGKSSPAPQLTVVAPEAVAAPKPASVTSAAGKEGAAAQLAAAASKAPTAEAASKDASAPKLVAVASKEAVAVAEPASKDTSATKPTADASKEAPAAQAAGASKDAPVAQAAPNAQAAPTATASKEASAAKVSTAAGKDAPSAKSTAATTHLPS